MIEQLEVLKVVTGRLDAAGIPYMVTGSMALDYYAVPRVTHDIDVVVELSTADADRVCDLFREDFYVEPETVRESVEKQGEELKTILEKMATVAPRSPMRRGLKDLAMNADEEGIGAVVYSPRRRGGRFPENRVRPGTPRT